MAGLPIDFSTQFDAVKRKQKIADLLTSKGLTPREDRVAGGQVVPISWGEALMPSLQGVAGALLDRKLKGESTALAEQYKGQLGTEVDSYLSSQTSKDPAERRAAIVQAMTSQFPEIKALGAAMLKQPTGPKLSDISRIATAKTALDYAKTGDMAVLTPKTDYDSVDGILYRDPEGEEVGPQVVKLNEGYGTETINGDLVRVNPSTQKKEVVDNGTRVSMVNSGPDAGKTAYFKSLAKQVDAHGVKAENSAEMLSIIDTLKELEPGINSNMTSDWVTKAQNIGQAFNLDVDTEALGKTETYNAVMIDLWQRSVAKAGSNVNLTAKETAKIEEQLPLAKHSPEARKLILGIMTDAARRNIENYKRANKNFAKIVGIDPNLVDDEQLTESIYIPKGAELKGGGGAAQREFNLEDATPEQKARIIRMLQQEPR